MWRVGHQSASGCNDTASHPRSPSHVSSSRAVRQPWRISHVNGHGASAGRSLHPTMAFPHFLAYQHPCPQHPCPQRLCPCSLLPSGAHLLLRWMRVEQQVTHALLVLVVRTLEVTVFEQRITPLPVFLCVSHLRFEHHVPQLPRARRYVAANTATTYRCTTTNAPSHLLLLLYAQHLDLKHQCTAPWHSPQPIRVDASTIAIAPHGCHRDDRPLASPAAQQRKV